MIRSIPDIQVTDQATRDALEAMKEIIEVMLGRRGSDPNDHVLTRGDSSTIIKLFEALNTGLSHDTLADVSADDHHSQSHTVVSHTDTSVTGAELDADHSKLAGVEANAKDDQVASEVTNTPAGNIAATDVQAAINELDTEKEGTATSHAARHVTGGGDTIADVIAAGNAGLMTGADKTKIDGIEAGAEVNNISDANATDLTDGGDTVLHDHDGISENTAARHTQDADTALGAVGTKDPPIDADKALYRDSTDSDALVTSTWTQIKAFLKTYFDALYPAIAHAIASHSDTTATGAELETLTDNSIADTLHRHSELVASDGSPDPALSVDNAGKVGIGTASPAKNLEVIGGIGISHTFPGFWLHEADGSKDAFFVLNTGNFAIQRRTPTYGAYEGVPFQIHLSAPDNSFTVKSSGKVGLGTSTPDTNLQVIGDTKFGDDNTNYVTTSATGDMVFVGGAGLCFGEIYGADTSTTETITTAGKVNKVQISAFAVNGNSNNATPDHTNDHITITKAGMYVCNVSMHILSPGGGGADNIGYSVYKNNGATEFANLHGQRDLAGGGGDEGSISLSGIIDLAVNDTIEVWLWNNTNNDDVIVDDINLSLVQIGGT